MGILLEIANRATDRTLDRLDLEGGLFKEILAEELQKEISHSLTDQSIENSLTKTFDTIISLDDYLDNEWSHIKEH